VHPACPVKCEAYLTGVPLATLSPELVEWERVVNTPERQKPKNLYPVKFFGKDSGADLTGAV